MDYPSIPYINFMTNNKLKISKKGFTLGELMVVVVIVGVLVSIAVPQYGAAIERMRAAEGIQILTSYLHAQESFRLRNGGTYATNLQINQLDIILPTGAGSYFNAPTIASANPIVSIARNGTQNPTPNYALTISSTGIVSCNDGGAMTTCTRLGCSAGVCN